MAFLTERTRQHLQQNTPTTRGKMEVEVDPLGERETRGYPPAEAMNDYCNSLVTACCVLLACARALMPVWVRIWYFDSIDVAWV